MILFEFQTGYIGETAETAYVWAASEQRARDLFAARHGAKRDVTNCRVRQLLIAADGEFCTDLCSEGWPE